jgi:glycosyltransferase involved in cell wall biosynthesis
MISIIIPFYNESKNINPLISRLEAVFEGRDYEVVCINDGSRDNTSYLLQERIANNARIRLIEFTRNFGQHAALHAGLYYAKGDVVVLMDGDLQNPPEEVPKLLKKLEEGFDIVYGVRQHRADSFMRKAGSTFYHFLIKKLTGVDLPDIGTSLRVFRRRVVEQLLKIPEQSRYITILSAWMGYKSAPVVINHERRVHGTSNYSLWKLVVMTFELVMGFSPRLLRLITFFGLFVSALSFFLGGYFFILKIFYGKVLPGFTALVVLITFFFGVLFIFLGIVSEYIAKIFYASLGRPYYVINSITEEACEHLHTGSRSDKIWASRGLRN